MDWTQEAKSVFEVPKPLQFTDYNHCSECAEHDATLREHDMEFIGLDQLGYPSYDPLSFCTPEGLIYYLPALIRFTLETVNAPQNTYLGQFLFPLIQDGQENALVVSFSSRQRAFIAGSLEYLIECIPSAIGEAHAIWSVEARSFEGVSCTVC